MNIHTGRRQARPNQPCRHEVQKKEHQPIGEENSLQKAEGPLLDVDPGIGSSAQPGENLLLHLAVQCMEQQPGSLTWLDSGRPYA